MYATGGVIPPGHVWHYNSTPCTVYVKPLISDPSGMDIGTEEEEEIELIPGISPPVVPATPAPEPAQEPEPVKEPV